MNVREEYIRSLFSISRNCHPDIWLKFVSVLSDYTMDQMERVIISVPTDEALIAIGMVRHMREFRDEVRNIETLYNKLEGKSGRGL